jgi:hypothetical protein
MWHLLDGQPFLRLAVLIIAAIVFTVIAQRGLRYGYVPMQIYAWRRKTNPFTYWCFMIFYCVATLGLWGMAVGTLLKIVPGA